MIKIFIVAALFITLTFIPVFATIINVPGDELSIQLGINAAADGDTILVQPGTYNENLFCNTRVVTLASLFLTSQDSAYVLSTIIDGSNSGSAVIFANHSDIPPRLVGFTIRNGNAAYGGGVKCENSNAVIANNVITDNIGVYGGGIYCIHAAATMDGNIIIDNDAPFGGGICVYQGGVTLESNIITSNSASDWGGGILLYVANSSLSKNVINGNAAAYGGGIYCFYSDDLITNNMIYGNMAAYGAGLHCESADPQIINNTFSRNYSSTIGGGIYCHLNSNPVVTNSIFWADSAGSTGYEIYAFESAPTFSYCDIQGGWTGEMNINIDPFFRDADNDDFHLISTEYGYSDNSPCIDIGHPDFWDWMISSQWGLGTYLSDLGAYGGGDSSHVLEAPALDSPPNEAVINELAPLLIWSDMPGADLYEIRLDNTPTFESPDRQGSSAVSQWTVNPELGLGTWYWQVRAHNSVGWSDWADPWDFEVTDLPLAPILIFPPNDTTLRDEPVFLIWHQVALADSFGVELSEDSLFGNVYSMAVSAGDTSVDVTDYMIFAETWFWRVNSGNDIGWGDWSEIRTFAFGLTGIDDNHNALTPRGYFIDQSYPNPFNAYTTISYGLPEAAHVSIGVYDILGRKVETLLDHFQTAGYYQIRWEAAGHPSGVYFYRIQADDFGETKSMLLLK